jgi:hypothetical protein
MLRAATKPTVQPCLPACLQAGASVAATLQRFHLSNPSCVPPLFLKLQGCRSGLCDSDLECCDPAAPFCVEWPYLQDGSKLCNCELALAYVLSKSGLLKKTAQSTAAVVKIFPTG